MGSDGSPEATGEEDLADHRTQVLALHAYVMRLLMGDAARAEDIVQETLLRCWRTYGSIGNAMLRPWMFRVAKNLVIDSYRSSKTRPQEIGGELLDDCDSSELDTAAEVLNDIMVHQALPALSPAHREALYEVYFRGRTLEEAAHSLRIPKGTLKSRIHYGLQALQKVLAPAYGVFKVERCGGVRGPGGW
ncbi:sigma-70 family RNA polymerase sigma factor [Streptomyces sp. NPDC004542]|uniref:sigma-70 family RNA polymerase sigma factor n=1 Tax=Streptomyces sp. NPDC004542 TaxID=3154281 RepID=UPI0033B4B346